MFGKLTGIKNEVQKLKDLGRDHRSMDIEYRHKIYGRINELENEVKEVKIKLDLLIKLLTKGE